jgi:hypothetical protein
LQGSYPMRCGITITITRTPYLTAECLTHSTSPSARIVLGAG